MKLDLSQLIDKTAYKVDIEETIDIKISNESALKQRNIELEKPVTIKGSIYRVDDDAHLDASLTYEYIANCDRCLIEFSNQIETVLSAKVIEKSNEQTEEEDEVIIYYDGEDLEIEDTIMSSVLLSLPMKSICNEECKGLCDKCGTDLNTQPCNCIKEDTDPRLAKLKDLFK